MAPPSFSFHSGTAVRTLWMLHLLLSSHRSLRLRLFFSAYFFLLSGQVTFVILWFFSVTFSFCLWAQLECPSFWLLYQSFHLILCYIFFFFSESFYFPFVPRLCEIACQSIFMMVALKSLLDHISICVILVLASMYCEFSFKWRVPGCWYDQWLLCFFFLFWPHCLACGIFILQTRNKNLCPLQWKQSPNRWTAGEVLVWPVTFDCILGTCGIVLRAWIPRHVLLCR